MTQLSWTQSSITLENDDAQLVYHKLRMGEYYEQMHALNTAHIAELETNVATLAEQLRIKDGMIESLQVKVEAQEAKIESWEETHDEEVMYYKNKIFKTGVKVGVVCLSLGVVITVIAIN